MIFQKLESLEIDYVNNDLKRFTFLEYIVLLPLNLLKIKKDKSKLDELIDSVKLYNDNSNTNPEKQLLYNDLKIIKILAENQILAYCTSLVSKVFNLEYKEIREIYLSFYSSVCFTDYFEGGFSKNTNSLKNEKLFLEVDDDKHEINIHFPLFHVFFSE